MSRVAKPRPPLTTRVAASRYLRASPRSFVWRDSSASPVARVRSLGWFLTGGWRTEGVRFVLRLVLNTVGGRAADKGGKTEGAA